MTFRKKSAGTAKKSFGQNFLIDQQVVERILEAAEISEGDLVVEIGPGRGALTAALLERGAIVTAIELERDAIAFLKAEFRDAVNLELVEGDALRTDFAAICSHRAKLVANLPYNVATAILQRLTEHRDLFTSLVLMFQREVVERITAAPATPERGFLSVIAQRYFSVEHLFDVPPNAFRPVPKVTSAICRLRPRIVEPRFPESLFRGLVSAGFAQRRKTLGNNLKNAPRELFVAGFDPVPVLDELQIDPRRRAETLTNDEWKRLATAVANNSDSND